MASDKGYLKYILEGLSALEEIESRAMMGEYLLYYKGRLFGGIYDDRLLVKPVPPAKELLKNAPMEAPYEGAKAMLLVEEVDDPAFLCRLVCAMFDALPAPKAKKRQNKA